VAGVEATYGKVNVTRLVIAIAVRVPHDRAVIC
jgi:hypothetical protein